VHTILERTLIPSPVQICLIVVLTGIGVGVAHPGSALVGLIIVLPIAVAALVRHLQRTVLRPRTSPLGAGARHAEPVPAHRRTTRTDLVWAGLLAALALTITAVWFLMTPSTATAPWAAFQTSPEALGEVAFGGAMGRPPLLLLVVLSGIGLLAALLGKGRDRLVLLALAGPGIVYWASAAAPEEAWRDLLSGFFYRDNFRTAAALTLGAVPVALMGVQTLARGLEALISLLARRRTDSAPRPLVSAVVGVVVGALAAIGLATHVSEDPNVRTRYDNASQAYRTWEISDLVSTDEFVMFEELPEYVPEDAYVIADPWEGGGLAYAFSDREVNRMYMTVRRTPEERYLDANLKNIGTDPKVCEGLPTDQPLYYLDLEEHRLGKDDAKVSGYLGYLDITDDTPGFDLVHEVGDVHLYEVDAC
jgi:hypothetical protein